MNLRARERGSGVQDCEPYPGGMNDGSPRFSEPILPGILVAGGRTLAALPLN